MAIQGGEEVGNRVYLLNPFENLGCLHLKAREQFEASRICSPSSRCELPLGRWT
jgi:hypothetical protein